MPETPKNSSHHLNKPYNRPSSNNSTTNSEQHDTRLQHSVDELLALLSAQDVDSNESQIADGIVTSTMLYMPDANECTNVNQQFEDVLEVLHKHSDEQQSVSGDESHSASTSYMVPDLQHEPNSETILATHSKDLLLPHQREQFMSVVQNAHKVIQMRPLISQQSQLQHNISQVLQHLTVLSDRLTNIQQQIQHSRQEYEQLALNSASALREIVDTLTNISRTNTHVNVLQENMQTQLPVAQTACAASNQQTQDAHLSDGIDYETVATTTTHNETATNTVLVNVVPHTKPECPRSQPSSVCTKTTISSLSQHITALIDSNISFTPHVSSSCTTECGPSALPDSTMQVDTDLLAHNFILKLKYIPSLLPQHRANIADICLTKIHEYIYIKHTRISYLMQQNYARNDYILALPAQDQHNNNVIMLVPQHKLYFTHVDLENARKYSAANMHTGTKALVGYVCTNTQQCIACAANISLRDRHKIPLSYTVDLAVRIGLSREQMCLRLSAETMAHMEQMPRRITLVHDRCISIARRNKVHPDRYAKCVNTYTSFIASETALYGDKVSLSDIHANTMRVLQLDEYIRSSSVVFLHDLATKTLEKYSEICAVRKNSVPLDMVAARHKMYNTPISTQYVYIDRALLKTEMINVARQIHTIRESLNRSPHAPYIVFGNISNVWLYLMYDKDDILNIVLNNRKKPILQLRNMSHVICRSYAIAEYACDPLLFVYPQKKKGVLSAFDPFVDEDYSKTHKTNVIVGDMAEALADELYIKQLRLKLHEMDIHDCDSILLECSATSQMFKKQIALKQYVSAFKILEDKFSAIRSILVKQHGFVEVQCNSYTMRGYNTFDYDEVCSQLVIVDATERALAYTYLIVSEHLDETRRIMFGCLDNIQRKLHDILHIEDRTAILHEFDKVFLCKSYNFIVEMQTVRIRQLHTLVNYEMQYVNNTRIDDCKACRVLNAGHFTQSKHCIDCLSFLCLSEGIDTLTQVMGNVIHGINLNTILDNMELSTTDRSTFIYQLSQYVCNAQIAKHAT